MWSQTENLKEGYILAYGFREMICPICGKSFIPGAQHIYKSEIDGKLVCTWSCMLESEKKNKKLKSKRYLPYNGGTINGV